MQEHVRQTWFLLSCRKDCLDLYKRSIKSLASSEMGDVFLCVLIGSRTGAAPQSRFSINDGGGLQSYISGLRNSFSQKKNEDN